ncbi:MAG: polysaccharide deacetylase family protein [Armatimonadota bacterium]
MRILTKLSGLLFIFLLSLGCGFSGNDGAGKATGTDSRNQSLQRTPSVNTAVPERQDPYWIRAQQEVYRSPEELEAQDVREKRRGLTLAKLSRGNPREKVLALTFDDGPHPEFTLKLLEILKAENVVATFFVIGKMVEKHPELVKALDDAGMEVANHTFSHVTLTKIPYEEIVTEYRANNELVEKITNKRMKYCRPPGGDYDADVIAAASAEKLKTVLWTDDPGDYASPGGNVIEQRTLSKLSNGGVILLHDGVDQTLQMLPQIIQYAKKQGYRFVSVSELDRGVSR